MSEEEKIYEPKAAKHPFQSKTLWANLLLAVVAFFPAVNDLVSPEHIGTIFMVVNTILRFATKSALSLK